MAENEITVAGLQSQLRSEREMVAILRRALIEKETELAKAKAVADSLDSILRRALIR